MTRSIAIILLLILPQACLGAVPGIFEDKEFNSATFAEAVNHYVELGEEAAVKELLDVAAGKLAPFRNQLTIHERFGWICRVLFEPKNAEPLREPFYGGLSLPYNTMPLKNWPLFPVAHSGSTYFVLSEGYILRGLAEDPEDYIDYCRSVGVFRKTKIAVPTRDQARTDAAALRKSKPWTEIKWVDSGQYWSYSHNEKWVFEFIQKQADNIR